MKIVMACVYVRARWVRLCEQLFGLSPFEAYEHVQRSDPDLFAASNHLSAMARRALQDPVVMVKRHLTNGLRAALTVRSYISNLLAKVQLATVFCKESVPPDA